MSVLPFALQHVGDIRTRTMQAFLWLGHLMVPPILFLWRTLLWWRLDYLYWRTLTSWMFWLKLSREQPQRASAQLSAEEKEGGG